MSNTLARKVEIKVIRFLVVLIAIFLTSCTTLQNDQKNPNIPLSKKEQPTDHQKIYYFQHRLLPKWTHESKGMFFDDLMNDNTEKLFSAASEIIGSAFANKISIKKFIDGKGVLLTFPPPKEPPECYFIYIIKKEDKCRFYTYESTLDIFKSGNYGVVGEWSADGSHLNLGPRKYMDDESFISEFQ